MKFKLLALALCTLLFTSCIDIFHTVSLHKGRADITVRYTLDKSIFSMAASMSGEEPDYSEFTEIGDEIFGEFQGISAGVETINTQYQLGAKVEFSGSVKKLITELDETFFLPIKEDDSYRIMIPSLQEEESEADETELSFLSGAKYSLLVDLSGDFKDIHRAKLSGVDMYLPAGSDDEINVDIYGSSMLIEIPLLYLFLSPEGVSIELHP